MDAMIDISLFPHQVSSIEKMENLEKNQEVELKDNNLILKTKVGINCNKYGSGKTLSMVSLIARNKMNWNVEEPFICEEHYSCADNNLMIQSKTKYEKNNMTLIICTSSVAYHWVEELSHSKLNYHLVTKKEHLTTTRNDFDVIVCISTLFRNICEKYYKVAWKRIIFDEPFVLKLPLVYELKAGFIWLITAFSDKLANLPKAKNTVIGKILNSYRFSKFRESLEIRENNDFISSCYIYPNINFENHSCVYKINFSYFPK